MQKPALIICTVIALTLSHHETNSHALEKEEGWLA